MIIFKAALVLAFSSLQFVAPIDNNNNAHTACSTRTTTLEEKEHVKKLVHEFKLKKKINKCYKFDVYFHVLMGTNGEGALTDEVINTNMGYLNEGFSGNLKTYNTDCEGNTVSGRETSIRFTLKNINRITNDVWFNVNDDDETLQLEITNANNVKGCSNMNVYSFGEINANASFASLPIGCDSNEAKDSVFMIYKEFDGHSDSFGAGSDTFIHEVGHWVGLDHVFEGGCDSAEGDGVDDTPPQTVTDMDCPLNKDTCAGGGVDSIRNYMDYSSDCCMYKFSEGQMTRAHALLDQYRGGGSSTACDDETGGNNPNPNPGDNCRGFWESGQKMLKDLFA